MKLISFIIRLPRQVIQIRAETVIVVINVAIFL